MPRWSLWPELLLVLAVIVGLVALAHCKTTSPPNAFGAVIYHENPYTYLMGSIADGRVLQGNPPATNVRFNPSFTYQLFDETVLFCGDVSRRFNRAPAGPIVVTYRRTASRLFNGVPCHDLISVDTVKPINP